MNHVSIVVSCYNPRYFLLEAIASARAQTSCAVEVILVNDGTNRREGREVLEKARALADRYI